MTTSQRSIAGIATILALFLAACGPSGEQAEVESAQKFEKKVEEVAGFKVPGGIPDL